jgi:hypothetical protein
MGAKSAAVAVVTRRSTVSVEVAMSHQRRADRGKGTFVHPIAVG